MDLRIFDRLMGDAEEAFGLGRLEDARHHFLQAEKTARKSGEKDEADRALCNACFVEIEMGRAEESIPVLRRIFMGTMHPRNRCVASYNIAAAYINTGAVDKAREWAERSRKLVLEVDDPILRAGTNNQAGSLALKLSNFEEAQEAFEEARQALDKMPADLSKTDAVRANKATIRDNLGYCLICRDQIDEGLILCEDACRKLEKLQAEHLLYETLQDLCYGYILADRLPEAHQCGEKAISLAEKYDDLQVMKNCLFLLAEIAVRREDTFRARRYLRELAEFYTEVEMNEEMIDIFLMTDLTHVVNLRG